MAQLPWVTDCVQDSVLPRLPTALVDDSSSESSDDESPHAPVVQRRPAGARLATPSICAAYYPGGASPRSWRLQTAACTSLADSTLTQPLTEHPQNPWKAITQHTMKQATIEELPAMASFYWSQVTAHMVKLLRRVKTELDGTWGTRHPSARWRLVKSTMRSLLLHKMSKAKLLYRALERILFTVPAEASPGPAKASSRRHRALPPPAAPHNFCDLPQRVQADMRLLGLEGLSAAEAHARLSTVLRKSEDKEAAARRKFQAARLRFVQKLRQLFDEIDETGDGQVDRGELRRYVAALQRRRPDLPLYGEVDSIFSSLDRDRSGVVSFAELLRLWFPYLSLRECELVAQAAPSSHPQPAEPADTGHAWGAADIALMKREFAALDASGDGTVDINEFETGMLSLWGVTLHTKGRRRYVRMVQEWFAQIDSDGSGAIDFDEFHDWYRQSMADARDAGVT
eukprot:jgi/Ulvmu1/647/UM010_0017.1